MARQGRLRGRKSSKLKTRPQLGTDVLVSQLSKNHIISRGETNVHVLVEVLKRRLHEQTERNKKLKTKLERARQRFVPLSMRDSRNPLNRKCEACEARILSECGACGARALAAVDYERKLAESAAEIAKLKEDVDLLRQDTTTSTALEHKTAASEFFVEVQRLRGLLRKQGTSISPSARLNNTQAMSSSRPPDARAALPHAPHSSPPAPPQRKKKLTQKTYRAAASGGDGPGNNISKLLGLQPAASIPKFELKKRGPQKSRNKKKKRRSKPAAPTVTEEEQRGPGVRVVTYNGPDVTKEAATAAGQPPQPRIHVQLKRNRFRFYSIFEQQHAVLRLQRWIRAQKRGAAFRSALALRCQMRLGATQIQRQLRGRAARREASTRRGRRDGAKELQAAWRGSVERKRFGPKLRRHRAVKSIQGGARQWRRRRKRREALRRQDASVKLQSVQRGRKGRQRAAGRRGRANAAIVIAARQRGITSRKRTKRIRTDRASTAIQSVYRRRAATRDVAALRQRTTAAVVLQSVSRGRAVRTFEARQQRQRREVGAATTINARVRGVQERSRHRRRREDRSATRINARVRGAQVRSRQRRRQESAAATVIGARARGMQGRKRHQRRKKERRTRLPEMMGNAKSSDADGGATATSETDGCKVAVEVLRAAGIPCAMVSGAADRMPYVCQLSCGDQKHRTSAVKKKTESLALSWGETFEFRFPSRKAAAAAKMKIVVRVMDEGDIITKDDGLVCTAIIDLRDVRGHQHAAGSEPRVVELQNVSTETDCEKSRAQLWLRISRKGWLPSMAMTPLAAGSATAAAASSSPPSPTLSQGSTRSRSPDGSRSTARSRSRSGSRSGSESGSDRSRSRSPSGSEGSRSGSDEEDMFTTDLG